jgi:uncharacterized membrane protein
MLSIHNALHVLIIALCIAGLVVLGVNSLISFALFFLIGWFGADLFGEMRRRSRLRSAAQNSTSTEAK